MDSLIIWRYFHNLPETLILIQGGDIKRGIYLLKDDKMDFIGIWRHFH
jgi:hypothetical protein